MHDYARSKTKFGCSSEKLSFEDASHFTCQYLQVLIPAARHIVVPQYAEVNRAANFASYLSGFSKVLFNMNHYPYVSLSKSIAIMRIVVALLFMAHAAVRIANNSIPQFGLFLESKGFLYGASLVWLISTYELAGGMLLAVGLIATGLFIIACTGILLIHMQNGWFVGEHGTGGMEYSFSLIVSLIVIAAASAESNKSKS